MKDPDGLDKTEVNACHFPFNKLIFRKTFIILSTVN